MKNLLLFFILIPLISFSQMTERGQKMQFRSYGSLNQPNFRNEVPRFNSSEYSQKQNFRDERQQPRPSPRNPGIKYYDPFWNYWGGWYRWGAPTFGFNYWNNWYWYDRWGYRNPARVYVYNDGRRDTIRAKATRISFGIQRSNDKSVGAFITIGNRGYFIAEYQKTFQKDISTYYPNITMDVALPWKDKRLEDLLNVSTLYLGAGKKINRTGFHTLIGFGRETKRFQYEDEQYILANNGIYSFPNYSQNFVTVKVGAIHDFKHISIKGDVDPVRKIITFGAGLNF